MTEAEWLSTTELRPHMWNLVRTRLSPRKLRLFGAAYCARLRQVPYFRDFVVYEPWAEMVADGCMDLDAAWEGVNKANARRVLQNGENGFVHLLEREPEKGVAIVLSFYYDEDTDHQAAEYLRCIIGNPFRPVALNRAWLTATVTGLAETIYQERAFDRLPILADALEDAGYENRDILQHCRQDGEHVRGCWVVDLLTGKE